jgi:hypothetical protein
MSKNVELSSPAAIGLYFKNLFERRSTEEIREASVKIHNGGFQDLFPDGTANRIFAQAGLAKILQDRGACLVG